MQAAEAKQTHEECEAKQTHAERDAMASPATGKDESAESKAFCPREFAIRQMRRNFSLLVIGDRESPMKSFALRMLAEADRPAFGRALCITDDETVRAIAPHAMICEKYSDKVDAWLADLWTAAQSADGSGVAPPIALLWIELELAPRILSTASVRRALMNNHHMGLTVVCITSYPQSMKPDLRANVDYVVGLRDSPELLRGVLHRQFFEDVFSALKQFGDCLDALARKDEALVLNQTTRSASLADRVFFVSRNSP